jgi:hypothetical protein
MGQWVAGSQTNVPAKQGSNTGGGKIGPSLGARGVRADPADGGVVVSVGPLDESSRWVKTWMTFPVTPESIPIAVSGQWTDTTIVGQDGGEFSTFGGRNLDTISFSGRLEPPLYYVSAAAGPLGVDPARFGNFDEQGEGEFLRGAANFQIKTGVHNQPGVATLAADQNVVMDYNARAGPNDYYEPHAFKEIITKAVKHGEIVRLVIGDAWGWGGTASIREFSWRYEDPDPDVLLFDITFRQHRERELAGVTGQINSKKKSTKKSHTTKRYDTLFSLAQEHLGDGNKWTTLRKLNEAALKKLWLWDDPTGRETQLAHKVRQAGASPAPSSWPAHLAFAEGVSLVLRK